MATAKLQAASATDSHLCKLLLKLLPAQHIDLRIVSLPFCGPGGVQFCPQGLIWQKGQHLLPGCLRGQQALIGQYVLRYMLSQGQRVRSRQTKVMSAGACAAMSARTSRP